MHRPLKASGALVFSLVLGGCGELFMPAPAPTWVHTPPVTEAQQSADFNNCSMEATRMQRSQSALSGSMMSSEFWLDERDRCLNRKGYILPNPILTRQQRLQGWNP